MRILLAGDYAFHIYEPACAQALTELGHEVIRFSWHPYFEGIRGALERHYTIHGPRSRRLNVDLLDAAAGAKPDVVLVWRGTHVRGETITEIRRRTGAFVVSYNNDDPFSPAYGKSSSIFRRRLWQVFLRSIPAYDMHFAYRRHNVDEFAAMGARRVSMLLPYFIPDRDRPLALTDEDERRFGCDVTFVGHYEADGRLECLVRMVEAGLKVRLFGTGWTKRVLGGAFRHFGDVVPVRGVDYTKALRGAKVCLAFLSKLNRDAYTRRTFEIPATASVMLSEYSPELDTLFEEDKEVLLFRSPSEGVEKARSIVGDPLHRSRIGEAARRRCLESGYDVKSRMAQWVRDVTAARAA